MDVNTLLQRYGEGGEEETFTFALAGGEELTARRLKDASKIMALERHVAHVQKLCGMGGTPEYQPYLPIDKDLIRFCVYAEALLVEPKISLVDAFNLSKNCGLLMVEIGTKVMQETRGMVLNAEVEEIEEAKNS